MRKNSRNSQRIVKLKKPYLLNATQGFKNFTQ